MSLKVVVCQHFIGSNPVDIDKLTWLVAPNFHFLCCHSLVTIHVSSHLKDYHCLSITHERLASKQYSVYITHHTFIFKYYKLVLKQFFRCYFYCVLPNSFCFIVHPQGKTWGILNRMHQAKEALCLLLV